MSRKPSEPFVQWKVTIPAGVAATIEMQIMDPVLRKPQYGKRSELITTLLTKYLNEQGVKVPVLGQNG